MRIQLHKTFFPSQPLNEIPFKGKLSYKYSEWRRKLRKDANVLICGAFTLLKIHCKNTATMRQATMRHFIDRWTRADINLISPLPSSVSNFRVWKDRSRAFWNRLVWLLFIRSIKTFILGMVHSCGLFFLQSQGVNILFLRYKSFNFTQSWILVSLFLGKLFQFQMWPPFSPFVPDKNREMLNIRTNVEWSAIEYDRIAPTQKRG